MSIEGDTRMRSDRPWNRSHSVFWIMAWGLILPCDVLAYVDPGTSGMLSQVLYIMFYGALGLLFYLRNQIKVYFARRMGFFAKIFGGSSQS